MSSCCAVFPTNRSRPAIVRSSIVAGEVSAPACRMEIQAVLAVFRIRLVDRFDDSVGKHDEPGADLQCNGSRFVDGAGLDSKRKATHIETFDSS
jgi:hypothetical protein